MTHSLKMTLPLLASMLCLTACEEIDALVENEIAANEAAYMPMQVMATLSVGLEIADDLATAAESTLGGAEVGAGQCWTAEVLADNGQGGGIVTFTFAGCPSRSGDVVVTMTTPPAPSEEPVLYIGGPVSMAFQDYNAQGMTVNGSIEFDSTGNEGTVTSTLATEFGPYAGELNASGPWTVLSQDALYLSMAGTYESATGLDWDVYASGLTLASDCVGAATGDLTSVFENPVGAIEAVAAFDGSCDGCATSTVNGAPQGEVCVPDSMMP